MKKFIKYCLYFVLPILIAAIPLEYMIRQIPNPYKYKYEWMQNNAEDVEILILGSSQAMYGIRPDYMAGKAFNLAFESQVVAYDYFLVKKFSSKYKKLKTIILPISYFTLFYRFEDLDSWWKCRYHHIYMDCNYHPYSLKYNFELSHYPSAMKKLKSYIGRTLRNQNHNIIDKYGWGNTYLFSKRNTHDITDTQKVLSTIKWQTANDWTHIDEIVSSLNNIINFCKSNHIDLFLITPPAWHTYYDNLDIRQYTKMHQLIDSVRLANDLQYFDYLKDKRFTFDDFYDNSHLNEEGAIKFTKILDEDIRSTKKSK